MTVAGSSTASNVYAGGPRLDWDERYEDILGAQECWVTVLMIDR